MSSEKEEEEEEELKSSSKLVNRHVKDTIQCLTPTFPNTLKESPQRRLFKDDWWNIKSLLSYRTSLPKRPDSVLSSLVCKLQILYHTKNPKRDRKIPFDTKMS